VLGVPEEVVSKVLLTATVLGGLALCFFGCRLFRLALGVAGFVCGAAGACYVAWWQTASAEVLEAAGTHAEVIDAILKAPNRQVLLVWAAAGGVAGCLVSVFLHRVGVFALGAWLGYLLAQATMARATVDAYWMVLAILALIGGVLSLILRKPVVILSTAFNGALGLVLGLFVLIKDVTFLEAADLLRRFGRDAYIMLGCAAVLGAIGVYVQFVTLPKPKAEGPVYKKMKPRSSD